MAKYQQNDDVGWDRGREGYLDVPRKPVYAPMAKSAQKPKNDGPLISIANEERVGSLIAAGGMIWCVYSVTLDYAGVFSFEMLRPGPLEVCALGILVWLHGKWRRSTRT